MYVCACFLMNAYTYTCMYLCVCVYVCVCVCVCVYGVYVCVCAHTHTHKYICMSSECDRAGAHRHDVQVTNQAGDKGIRHGIYGACRSMQGVCVCMYTHVCMYTCVCMYTDIHMCTYIHTCI
jgi:hypothetical protein